MSEWTLSKAEIQRGQNEYLHYIGGVAIIHAPDSDFSQRNLGGSSCEDSDATLLHAEQLMYHGLRGLITWANPPHWRQNLQRYAEHHFDDALPHIQTIVADMYDDEQKLRRIRRISEAVEDFRPSTAEEPAVYHNLCHSRPGKLYTATLIDGLRPAPLFAALIPGRTVMAAVAKSRKPKTA